jgi:hypothetical protein
MTGPDPNPNMNENLPTIFDPSSGETRVLGLVPSDPRLVAAVPSWADAGNPVLPESEWKEFDEWPDAVKIKDQDGKGACNGHAAALAQELARYAAGMTHVPLSAWYVYSILCNGIDRGSSILDALALVKERGVAPEADVAYGLINPRRLTDQSHKDAARFKLEVGAKLTTWPEIVTAVLLRRPLNLSIQVGMGFNNLDAEGVPPVAMGPGNHAVCVAMGLKNSKKWGWLVKMPNSWGTQWGQNGFYWLSQRHVARSRWFECYEVSAVVDDPQDQTNPPNPQIES